MKENDLSCFTAGGKKIEVYPAAAPNRPVIYLNTFEGEGSRVRRALQAMGCPDHTLAAVSGLDWDHDMAPWDIPPVMKGDTPCTGGADAFLRLLTEEVIPKTEKLAGGNAPWRGIAGYSLAGLFAVYALYRTDVFTRAASMSGSLWFPDFREYVRSHEMKGTPSHIYFSLGDKESGTRNPYLQCVQENTEAIHSLYDQKGIETTFQLNPGGHFKNAVQRTASGIAWLLSR